ncbi:MAG TPA: glycosyltransferase family 9 protein, partial [Ignavibacteria bacterium]|nr:glycosyltransferase family 9 protein [Ignavibacteria bacterium]
ILNTQYPILYKKMKRILIVRTDRVGDVVMITPMIRELRKSFPDAFIATLTNTNTQDILINNPHLNQIIADDLSKNSFYSVTAKLREFNFTDGLLVMPTERAAYQMFLGGVKNRIGVGRKLYEVITLMKTVSRNKYIPLRHEADYCMDLARKIGVVTDDLTPEIYITAEEKKTGMEILRSFNVSESDMKIIVHTGSGKSSSNWSEDKYSELIKRIIDKYSSAKIILTAKEMSDNFKANIISLNSNNIVFPDQHIKRLRDLIRIISNTDLLIAPSTGPLHIASALKIKTIGLFCHRRMNCAKHWGALGSKAVNLEVSKGFCDANCSPDKETCMFEDGISVEEVLNNIP